MRKIKNTLYKRYELYWSNELSRPGSILQRNQTELNKLRTYITFKNTLKFEPYLQHIKRVEARKAVSQLRMSSHSLNIESLRGKVKDPTERICIMCDTNRTEDEVHFLMDCPKYDHLRDELINKVTGKFGNILLLNKEQKFEWLMTNEDEIVCKILGEYILQIFKCRKEAISR